MLENLQSQYPGRPLAIALVPRVRNLELGTTVDGQDHPVTIGHEIDLYLLMRHCKRSVFLIPCNWYKEHYQSDQPGRVIYVDDGVLSFEVLEIVNDKTIKVRAVNNGKISSHKVFIYQVTDVDLPGLVWKR